MGSICEFYFAQKTIFLIEEGGTNKKCKLQRIGVLLSQQLIYQYYVYAPNIKYYLNNHVFCECSTISSSIFHLTFFLIPSNV